MRTLLVVSGGIEALPGIREAKEMGLHVVVSDQAPDAPGFALADDRLLASTYDVEATVAIASDYHQNTRPIDGVICIAADVPLTVASVADELGLPGIPVDVARLATDKLAMKERFVELGIPVPWFATVESPTHLRALISSRPGTLVLKPVDSRGARGVLRLTKDVDPDWAYDLSRSQSPSGRVMVEDFLAGPQVSTESLVVDGHAHTLGFADRNYELLERYAPFMIEDGGELPSVLPPETQHDVRALIQQVVDGLGLDSGVVKGDIVVPNERPHVIETAFRLSGGHFCTVEIPLNTGVPFVRHAIRLALGERVSPAELVPRFERHVVQRYLFPDAGTVEGVQAPSRSREGIELLEIRVQEGDVIGPIDSHPARAGVVIASGDSREQAMERVQTTLREIEIRTHAAS